MKAISLLTLLIACSNMKEMEEQYKERPLQENQLVQCYLESDTYMEKKPFEAKMNMHISELGTITEAKVVSASSKDPNLNACLTYVMLGAGRPLKTNEKAGIKEKTLKFSPKGTHEL
jgi:hypothetical protein